MISLVQVLRVPETANLDFEEPCIVYSLMSVILFVERNILLGKPCSMPPARAEWSAAALVTQDSLNVSHEGRAYRRIFAAKCNWPGHATGPRQTRSLRRLPRYRL